MNEAMDTASFEERVRARAYELWESEGRPAGRDEEHWYASEEATRAELALAVPAKAPKAKAAPRGKKAALKPAATAAQMATRH
jgi:hypothetical protein